MTRAVAAAGLLVIAFGPFLISGFLLDDYFHLAAARHGLGRAVRFAIDSNEQHLFLWPRPDGVRFEFFRPLVGLTFWLDAALWGLRPIGFHLTNLLLHALNVWLLYAAACRLRLTERGAWVAAMVWGVSLHAAPAAGWISGRTEVLVVTFVLLSALAFLRWRETGRPRWFALTLGAIMLACGAKESGIVAPLLILLADRIAGFEPRLRRRDIGALLVPAVLYLGVRFVLFQSPLPPAPYFELPTSLSGVARIGASVPAYLLAALLSVPLVPLAVVDRLLQQPLLLLAAGAAAAGLTTVLVRAGRRRAVLLLGWFGCSLIPYAPVMASSLYLYLPLVGVALLFGVAVERAQGLAPRLWVAWLIGLGVAGNALAATAVRRVTRSVEEDAASLAHSVARVSASHLVIIDAPVWAYSLSAAMSLTQPQLRFDTHFLNFAPGILPGPPSGIRWRDSLTLELRAPDGSYFDSYVEEFMAFGGAAAVPAGRTRSPLSRVVLEGSPERPSALVFAFQSRSALDKAVVVQFQGWRAVSIPYPEPIH